MWLEVSKSNPLGKSAKEEDELWMRRWAEQHLCISLRAALFSGDAGFRDYLDATTNR